MAEPQPGEPACDYFLGFNLAIERDPITKLMGTIQGAIVSGAGSLTICLTSRGGDYAQAAYASELLSALTVPVNMHAVGTVRLSAVVLFMAGRRRYAAPGTDFLLGSGYVRPPSDLAYGAALALDEAAGGDAIDDIAIRRIARKTGRDPAEVAGWAGGKRFLDADFALSHGLIHEIRPLRIPADAVFIQIA